MLEVAHPSVILIMTSICHCDKSLQTIWKQTMTASNSHLGTYHFSCTHASACQICSPHFAAAVKCIPHEHLTNLYTLWALAFVYLNPDIGTQHLIVTFNFVQGVGQRCELLPWKAERDFVPRMTYSLLLLYYYYYYHHHHHHNHHHQHLHLLYARYLYLHSWDKLCP